MAPLYEVIIIKEALRYARVVNRSYSMYVHARLSMTGAMHLPAMQNINYSSAVRRCNFICSLGGRPCSGRRYAAL